MSDTESEFSGFGEEDIGESAEIDSIGSDISVSSFHTMDLSDFDDKDIDSDTVDSDHTADASDDDTGDDDYNTKSNIVTILVYAVSTALVFAALAVLVGYLYSKKRQARINNGKF